MNSEKMPIEKQAAPVWLGALARKARVAGGTLKRMNNGDFSFKRLRELYNGGNKRFGAAVARDKRLLDEAYRDWARANGAYEYNNGQIEGLWTASDKAMEVLPISEDMYKYRGALTRLRNSLYTDSMVGSRLRDADFGLSSAKRHLKYSLQDARNEARKAKLVRNAVNAAGIAGATGAAGLGGYALGSDTKAAEVQLEKQAQIKKILSEALVRSPKTTLKRLHVAMSPKVDPTKLNKFTRFFTKTRQHTAIPSGGAKSFVSGGPGGGDYYPIGSGIYDSVLNGTSRATTRLAPGRIAAALGLAGGTGYLGSSALSGSKSSTPSDKVRDVAGDVAGKARGFTDDAMEFVKAHPVAVVATTLGVPLLTAAAIKAFSRR